MNKEIYHILFFVLSCQNFLTAQNIYDTIHLPQIRVLSERSLEQAALPSFTIDPEIIKSNITSNLSEVLSRYSPIFIKTYGLGGLATASFRGTTASHTKVFWEGIPVNSPMAGQSDLSLLPLFFIGKLEILPGASSLVQGSGALGGTVSIESKIDRDHKILGLTHEFGAFGTNKTYLSLHKYLSKNYLAFRFFRESADNDFEFVNTASGRFDVQKQQNADYQKYGILTDYRLFINNKNTLSVHLWWQKSERNLPPIMSYAGVGRKEFQNDDEWRGILKWNRISDKLNSKLSVGGIYTHQYYHLSNDTPLGLVLNYDSKSNIKTGFLRWEADYTLKPDLLLKFRAENTYDQVHIFDNKTLLGYDADRNTFNLKSSIHHSVGYWKYYVLIHQNIISDYNVPLIWSAGIERHVGKKPWIFKFNSTRNYNIPSLNDLFWIPGGNPDLRPESGYSLELTVNKSFQLKNNWNWNIESGFFRTEMDDWILWKPGEFRFWTAENVQNVLSRGAELRSSMTKIFTQNSIFHLNINYSFTRTTDETEYSFLNDHTGRQLIYVPVQKFNVLTRYQLNTWSFNYESEWTDERFTTASNVPTRHRLPAYGLHHISVSKRLNLKQVEIAARIKVNNIFDKSYQAILWRAMPGRYINCTVQIEI